MQSGIAQIDFVALLAGEAGLGNDHPAAGDLGVEETVIRDVPDGVTDEIDHQRERFRSLDLYRADVDLIDRYVHAHPDVDALQPEQHVGVRQREPELVLGQAKQYRIV